MGDIPKNSSTVKTAEKNRPRGAMGKKSSRARHSAFDSLGPIFDVKKFLHKP